MAVDYMLCDIDVLYESSKKITDIKEKCDSILSIMQTYITALTDYDWHGDESMKFESEYLELKTTYENLSKTIDALAVRMNDFASKVEDVDNEFAAKFRAV